MTADSLNVWFNSICAMYLSAVLATEGIKCTGQVFGKVIKGSRAYCVFVGVFLFLSLQNWETSRAQWYFVNGLARFFCAIGLYSFVSRLYKALASRHG